MPGGPKETGGVYRPRHPQQSAFYQLVERLFPQFEAEYDERYQKRYGFWRPIVGTVVRKFLECGDPPSPCRASAGQASSTGSPASAAPSAVRSSSSRFRAGCDVSVPVATRNGRWRRPLGPAPP